MTRFIKNFTGVLCLLMSFSVSVLADNKVIGKWQGNIIVNKDKPMFVFLNIDSLSPAKKVLTLKYGQPYNCVIEAKYGGSVNKTQVFYIIENYKYRTFCYKDVYKKKAELRVTTTKTGKLSYDITSKGTSIQSVILTRQ